jgi:hypothetical protein
VAVAEVTVTPLALLVVLAAAVQEQVQELMLAVQVHQDKETLAVLAQTLLHFMVLEVVVALVQLAQTELVLRAVQAVLEPPQVLLGHQLLTLAEAGAARVAALYPQVAQVVEGLARLVQVVDRLELKILEAAVVVALVLVELAAVQAALAL